MPLVLLYMAQRDWSVCFPAATRQGLKSAAYHSEHLDTLSSGSLVLLDRLRSAITSTSIWHSAIGWQRAHTCQRRPIERYSCSLHLLVWRRVPLYCILDLPLLLVSFCQSGLFAKPVSNGLMFNQVCQTCNVIDHLGIGVFRPFTYWGSK